MTRVIREKLDLDTTGRPAKSTSSIIDKLSRESTRLSQIQDIAGCRIVVSDIAEQIIAAVDLTKYFPGARRVDRTRNPKYGYRAIHLIPNIDGKPIEIQIRTLAQHAWAELSEKYSDKFGHELKYGGGEDKHRNFLARLSELISTYERLQKYHIKKILEHNDTDKEKLEEEYKHLDELNQLSKEVVEIINEASDDIDTTLDGE